MTFHLVHLKGGERSFFLLAMMITNGEELYSPLLNSSIKIYMDSGRRFQIALFDVIFFKNKSHNFVTTCRAWLLIYIKITGRKKMCVEMLCNFGRKIKWYYLKMPSRKEIDWFGYYEEISISNFVSKLSSRPLIFGFHASFSRFCFSLVWFLERYQSQLNDLFSKQKYFLKHQNL